MSKSRHPLSPPLSSGPRLSLVAAAGVLGLAAARPAAAVDSAAVFSEIMYHPAGDGTEWIEVTNLMAVDMDLSGWRITEGVEFTFPENTVLPAGGHVVVASAPGSVPGAVGGAWSGNLSNGGERLRLVNVSGRIMDELDYRDGGGLWPAGGDGSGATLCRRDERQAAAGPDAWAASVAIGGTPGAANFPDSAPDAAGVRISEITGASEAVFRVELVNESAAPVSLAGMKLGAFALPDTTLAAGAMAVFDESALGFHPLAGDPLFLFGTGGATLVDAAVVRETARARRGKRMLVPSSATFGAANAFSLSTDVVINEIMFRAPPFPSEPGTPAVVQTSVLLPMDAVWRYYTGAGAAPAGWQTQTHAAGAAWVEGPALLGFETTPAILPETLRTAFANTNEVTYYFETTFTLTPETLAGLTTLRLEHIIDDGAVFYLNGVEMPGTRLNLPAGEVSHSTASTAGVGNAVVSAPVDVPVAGLPLVAGVNRLSVEVHQQIATSSDMVCGARLSALIITTPAVPAQPVVSNPEEWIELYNKGAAAVELSGWRLDDGMSYLFPGGTVIGAGEYLVVANDPAALRAKWPERASRIIGGFTSGLSNGGERIELRDAVGNPADTARYLPGEWSDGGGSSLELRDARDDNGQPDAWADSDETAKSEWQNFSWRTNGAQAFGPTTWNEFRLGMLDAGQCLIDDISVRRDPDGAAVEVIQNGNFETLPAGAKWRFLGNHGASAVIDDAGNPGGHVLRFAATGPMETNHNHAESTFVSNTALSASATYEVRFRARWLAGTNQLNTRAYYQKLAKTWELPIPARLGTPGAVNSRAVANAGPLLADLRHSPAIPAANEAVTVSLTASDPDGLGSATLFYRRDGTAAFTTVPMTLADGRWSAALPGQTAGIVTHFYAAVTDTAGATSFLPTKGPDSRALVQARDSQTSALKAHQLRLIMTAADRTFLLNTMNRLSNDRIPGTLIYRGNEVFHDVGVRLQGTAAGRVRDGDQYTGFDIGFPRDHLFRGVHDSVGVDRSGRTPNVRQQDEIYVRHTFNRAGIPCPVDDLCYFIGPSTVYTGTAILQMAAYGGLWVSSQYEEPEGISGTVYNWDITYDPTSTQTSGNPEALKPPVPFVHVATDLVSLGDDKEQYRGPYDIRAGKRRDDYTGLMNLAKTMALPAAQLALQAETVLDLDEVFRCTALVNLWGIEDTYYTGGLQHNIRLFVPDSGEGVKFLPWDMDFTMYRATNSAIMPSGNNLGKLITANSALRRRYLGQVRNLCETVFRADTLSPWLTRYGSVVGQNFSPAATYINDRRTYAATQYPTTIAFGLVTNSGADFTTDQSQTALEGNAWIDVRGIVLNGVPVEPAWSTQTRWSLTVPLAPGANVLTFEAQGYDGELLSTKTITVTSTAAPPAGFSTWRAQHFTAAEQANEAVSGPLADPTGTGMANLLRYAFGVAPRAATFPQPANVTSVAGMLRLEFTRVKDAPDIDYVPEISTNLGAWTALPGLPAVLREKGDGTETAAVETPMDGNVKFLRVRIRTK